MESRKLLIVPLLVLMMAAPALADGVITIRKLTDDRWIIEDGSGRGVASARSLNDHTIVIETPTGKNIVVIRRDRDDGDVDLDELCGNERASISCLLNEGDDE